MKYKRGYFRHKKITVMGLGLLGRGVGDAAFFAEEGAELIVTDLKTKEELASSVDELKGFVNIEFVLGKHRKRDFRNRDFILKAAGVPLDSPYIEEARKNNVPVEMSASLFAALTPATVVGVTGTRGKSTVTHLVYEILKASPATSPIDQGEYGPNANESDMKIVSRGRQIFLGGNIRGVSTLRFLHNTKPGDIAVLELDSWQLQGFGERKISPHIAVFTTFLPDHLNYYHGSLDAYLADKANIFKFQKEGDFFVLGAQASGVVLEKYGKEIAADLVAASGHDFPADWRIKIPGLHNRYNAALALKTAELLNVGRNIIQKTIEDFTGVAGRLEFRREYNGVKIYNDTTATTPDATLAGVRAFGTSKNVVLIMGGADKGLAMGHLFVDMPNYVKAVVSIPGTGTDRIKKDFQDLEKEGIAFSEAKDLKDAVLKALEVAKTGDNVILSPAFASFGQFKNEFDRGEQFDQIVNEL